MLDNKRILILGVTGSWGYCLTEKLLTLPITELRGFSRNEYNQVMMQRRFSDPRFKLILGDVRDYDAVLEASRDIDIIFLLSAIKHVPLAEKQPDEAIKTNIIGTQNVVKAAIANKVEKVIDVSTDKACSPNTLYGATKLVGEKLILNANHKSKTKFICIRAGNVLGSAGSVVPLFIEQIKKNNQMTITDCSMTRYFMTLPDAIELLIQAVNFKEEAEMLVMGMPSCTIGTLADAVGYRYGDEITTIREVGIRPGEKLHELLINEDESVNAYLYNDNYYVISQKPLDLPKAKFKEYGSNTQPLMSKDDILHLLERGGF